MADAEPRLLTPRRPGSAGAGLSLATLPVHIVIPHAASVQLAALVLGLVAGVYVGLALNDGRSSRLAVEAGVAAGFLAAALAGVLAWSWAIPLAYVFHGLWDFAHHRLVDTAIPRWYIPFCALFDWVFAACLTAAWALTA